MSNLNDLSFQIIIQALLNPEKPFPNKFIYRLSDIDTNDLQNLQQVWDDVPVKRRQYLMEDIEQLSEDNSILCFDAVCEHALSDKDPYVRELAIHILQDCDNKNLIGKFIEMMEADQSADVRAAATAALGKYVYLGEIDEITDSSYHLIEEHLLKKYQGNDATIVRQRALEALGYSSQKYVKNMIEKAYHSGNDAWIASSLFAMGRSVNSRWNPMVKNMLESDVPNVRLEAVRAAGELEIKESSDLLVELLDDPNEEIRRAAIWSLSQIGGEGIQELLEDLYDRNDNEEELEIIEAALDNLSFTQDVDLFSMIDVDEVDEEDLLDEDDLYEDNEDFNS